MSRTDTRQLLLDSMKELLNTVSFDRLRVQQICENAGTSRSVFYKYFTDKFDLAYYEYEKYEEELRRRLLNNEVHSIEEATLYRLQYIYDRRDYYRRLIPYSGQNSFHESTTVIFVRESVMFARQVTGKEELSTEVLFSITYHAAAQTEVILQWIRTGFRMPAETLAGLMTRNCYQYFLEIGVSPNRILKNQNNPG